MGTRRLAIVSKSTIGRFPLFTRHFITRYICVHARAYRRILPYTLQTRGRVYLQLPLESVNPVFQRISTVYIDIWLRLYSPRAVNHYSVAARPSSSASHRSLPLFPPPLSPTRSSVALHRCNYTKIPTRDDADVKREIGRVPPCVRRVPPFENCPAILSCILD